MKKTLVALTILIAVVLGLGTLISGKSLSLDRPDANLGRIAQKEEIIGYWQMIPLPEAAKKNLNKVDPWPQPHQWFAIHEDGRMYSMMSTEAQELSARELEGIFGAVRATVSYEYQNGLLLVRNRDIPGYGETWGVNVATENATIRGGGEIRPGDLLMGLIDGKNKQMVYYRHLRRVS